MKIFRFNVILHLINLIVVIYTFNKVIQNIKLNNNLINIIIIGIIFIVIVFVTIHYFYICIIVNEKSICHKTFLKKRIIKFKDIRSIKQYTYHGSIQIFKASINSNNEEVIISPVYRHYKELLQLVVDRCDKDKVFIESSIYEKLNS